MPEMKAIFFAEGPDIKPGVKLETFRNIGVYPFITQILGLTSPEVDGQPGTLSPALATHPAH